MKVKLKIEKEYDIKTLKVNAGVRYWEDAYVNGIQDTENGDNIPCKVGNMWCPEIDIESGNILNWKPGIKAHINYKVCDCLGFEILDDNDEIVLSSDDGYVPSTLSPAANGYGDYIKMKIDEFGKIDGWEFKIHDFINEEEY
jgi:hypothetical protein